MAKRELQFDDGKSQKFWTISLTGTSHTVTFGKTGTKGQTRTKDFDTKDEAKKSYDKLIEQKLGKGYAPAKKAVKKAAKKAANKKAAKPKVTQKGGAAKPAKSTGAEARFHEEIQTYLDTWRPLVEWFEKRDDPRGELLGLRQQLLTIDVPNRKTLEARLQQLLREGVEPVMATETNSLGMTFALITPGEFLMGSAKDDKFHEDNELQHRVWMTKPFYLGIHEVTQKHYESVMGVNPSEYKGEDRPVDHVTWDDAVKFCRRLSEQEGKTYKLPTEAQWEYACRAGTTTPFALGKNLCSETEACFDHEYTATVGKYLPNGWGLYDMLGNVDEWCADKYDEDYYKVSPLKDPPGPRAGKYRVTRGGNWAEIPEGLTAFYRSTWTRGFLSSIGCRIARTLDRTKEDAKEACAQFVEETMAKRYMRAKKKAAPKKKQAKKTAKKAPKPQKPKTIAKKKGERKIANTQKQIEQLMKRIAKSEIAHHAEYLRGLIRPSIEIVRKRGRVCLGSSRFSGPPDLPPRFEWPTHKLGPYGFLAQFNLEDLPDCGIALPNRGLLSFFFQYDEDGECFWQDRDYVIARYFPPRQKLVKTEVPESTRLLGDSVPIKFEAGIDLPQCDRITSPEIKGWPFTGEEEKPYAEIRESLHQHTDHLFGYPTTDTLCYDPTPNSKWSSLLTLASRDPWHWHDGDMLVVFIQETKLAKHDFSKLKADAG